jgi:hypothetical protein
MASCSYDLDEYYKRFDRCVVAAQNIGCDLTENYLMKLFAKGCSDHRDLKSRADMVHLELKDEISTYTDLKHLYDSLIKKKKKVTPDSGKNHYNSKKRHGKRISRSIKCFNCGEENHTVQSCTKEILKCKICGLYGHVEQNCSKKVEKGKSHVNHLKNDDKKEAKEWKYSLKARGLINKPNSSHYPLLYLDTCTSFSMTGDKNLLHDIQPWKGSVIGGDPRSQGNNISAIGKLVLEIRNEFGEKSTVEIENVRYVEDFNVTLIRPQQLWKDMEIEVNFLQNKIIGPDQRIIGNIVEDSVFLPYIQNCHIYTEETSKSYISRDIWHQRFGHISSEYINTMQKNAIVEGLNIDPGSQDEQQEKCDICNIMNNKKNNFKRIEETKTRGFGEVISVDIDELPVVSVEGYKYRLDIICHGSNWIWTFGLKRRSDSKEWIIFIVKRLRNSLIQIRVDGAKEFLANVVQNICKQHGVEFKVTDPYMHEQNGKVERVHLNIDSKVRVLLKRSGLPKTLWFKASKCAVHIINRTVTKALNFKKTTYEMKEGVKPSVKHFKIFGCKAYAHIPKEKRSKLDDQAIPSIFVGYSDKSSGYEFYNLITGEFFIAGSANFDENSFPGHEMSEEYKDMLIDDDDVNDEDYSEELDDHEDCWFRIDMRPGETKT